MASKNVRGLIVQIDGDTKGLSKALTAVEKQSKTLSTELKDIDKLLKFNPASVEALTQKKKVLSEAIQACAEKLKILQEAQEKYQEKIGEGNEDEHMRALKREIEFVTTKMGEYEQQLVGANTALDALSDTTDEVEAGTGDLGESVDELAADVDELNETLEESGNSGRRAKESYDSLKLMAGVLSTRFDHFSDQLSEVNGLLKDAPKNVELLRQKKALLSKSIDTAKSKLVLLKDAQKEAIEAFKAGDIAADKLEDLQFEISKTTAEIEILTKEMKTFGSVGAQQVAAVGGKVKDIGEKVEGAGQKLKGVSTVAATGLTLISKNAIDFESAWAGVTKTVDGTAEELETVKQGILDLSQETASSAIDIAAVAEAAGQLGIKTGDILDFTKTMVMLGDSTNLSADEAATALAKFANITQMSASDYGKLGSAIVDLGNNFATTEADIVAMATRLASTGEVTGLTEPQILALATTLSSVGIEAEAGGTAISKLLKKLYTCNAGFDTAQAAVNSTGMSLRELQLLQANNSKEFKSLADSLGYTSTELKGYIDNVATMNNYASTAGLSVDEFRKAYAQDAVGALSLFVAGLNNTEANGKNAVEILNEMGLTEVRLSNAILAMAASGNLLTDAVTTANTAWGENTALTTEAEKRYATTASQIQQLKGALTEMCVQLGAVLLPIIQSVVSVVKQWVNWFSNLSPTAQKIILAITAFAAALGPALIMIGKIISAVGTIMQFAPLIAQVITLIKAAASGLFSMIMSHPIIALIMAAVAAIIYLWNNCEGFRNFVIKLWEILKKVFNVVVEWVKKAIPVVVEFLKKAWEAIKTGFNAVVQFFINAWNAIKNAFVTAWEFLVGIFNAVINFVKDNWQGLLLLLVNPFWGAIKLLYDNCEGFRNFINNLFESIKNIAINAWNAIKNAFVTAWNFLVGIFNTVINFVKENWQGLLLLLVNPFWGAIKLLYDNCEVFRNFINNLFNNIKNIAITVWTAIKNFFVNLWNSMKTTAINVWTAVKNGIVNLWNGLKKTATTVWNAVKNFFVGLWNGIKNTAISVWNAVKNFFVGLWDGIKSGIVNVWNSIASFFTGLWDSIVSIATNAWNGFKEFISGVWEGIKNTFTSAWESMKNVGKNIVEGLWNGISGAASWLWEKITGFGNSIINWFKGIFGIKSPSRVFAGLGKYLDQGLAKGLTDNMDEPIKAAQAMAEGVLSSAQEINGFSIESNLRNRSVQMAAEVTAKSDSAMLAKLDRILSAIEAGQVITLDSKKLVGSTAAAYDNALGQRRMLAARGAI